MELGFTRPEQRGGICPDCGYFMQPGEVNEHMNAHVAEQRQARDWAYERAQEQR